MSEPLNLRVQGNTGVWTFAMRTPEDKVLATSEWGTNYLFNLEQFLALPTVTESPGPPPPAANPQAAAGNRSPAGAAALAQPTISERSIER